MKPDVAFDFSWSEKIMPQIKHILKDNAAYLLEVVTAPADDDMQRATDLKLRLTGGDVAVRVRRAGYDKRFHDITIRAVKGNAKTEIHKLRDGCARWYLYAWEEADGILSDWVLLDIDIMRTSGLLSENRDVIMNRDGYTGFVSYSLAELSQVGAIVAYK